MSAPNKAVINTLVVVYTHIHIFNIMSVVEKVINSKKLPRSPANKLYYQKNEEHVNYPFARSGCSGLVRQVRKCHVRLSIIKHFISDVFKLEIQAFQAKVGLRINLGLKSSTF